MVRNHRQQAYDFGKEGNLKHYGTVLAPGYDIRKISGVPIHIYYSDSDWLATSTDVEQHLLTGLHPRIQAGVHKLQGFNHNDFLWGLRAADEVYRPIIKEVKRGESRMLGLKQARLELKQEITTSPMGFRIEPLPLVVVEDSDLINDIK